MGEKVSVVTLLMNYSVMNSIAMTLELTQRHYRNVEEL